jgi:hypothetical protein
VAIFGGVGVDEVAIFGGVAVEEAIFCGAGVDDSAIFGGGVFGFNGFLRVIIGFFSKKNERDFLYGRGNWSTFYIYFLLSN